MLSKIGSEMGNTVRERRGGVGDLTGEKGTWCEGNRRGKGNATFAHPQVCSSAPVARPLGDNNAWGPLAHCQHT